MEGINQNNLPEKKEVDGFLGELWDGYDFPGKPPFKDSVAEKRLQDTCRQYTRFLDETTHVTNPKLYDTERRKLHNQIALMLVGKQRSGMDPELAEHIAGFAFEYTKGYKMKDEDKYKRGE